MLTYADRSHLLFDDVRHSLNASSKVAYFLFPVADVKCCLCEINKINRANATHGLGLVQKLF